MLRNLHRWTGLCAAVFLAALAITGLLINHTHSLGLDRASVDSQWLLEAYGLPQPEAPVGVPAGQLWVAWVSGNLLVGGETHRLATFIGAVDVEEIIVAAGRERLLLLTPDGDLIERMTGAALPGNIERIGTLDGRVALQTARGVYKADAAVVEWSPVSPGATTVEWASPVPVPPSARETLALAHAQPTLTWEQVLLDLHSGRLFGVGGQFIADLTAVAILYLLVSGLITWRRNGRGRR